MPMNSKIKIYSAVILAGGKSERMGYPKPWLTLEDDRTFLATLIDIFKRFNLNDIVVVLNKEFASQAWEKEILEINKDVILVENSHPEKGRLHSLQLGLQWVTNPFVFVHNVDNPFVEVETLMQLCDNENIKGVTIPSFLGKGGHPVLIAHHVKEKIKDLRHCDKTLREVFAEFPVKYIEVKSDSILKNINTPQDLKAVKHELA